METALGQVDGLKKKKKKHTVTETDLIVDKLKCNKTTVVKCVPP